jgi:hypothetical protein
MRPEQVNWHIRQHIAGGSSLIIVGIGRETWVTSGVHAREINQWTKDDFMTRAKSLQEMLDALENDQ